MSEYQYLEMSQYNNTTDDVILNIECERQEPIVADGNDNYYMSVDRFDLNNTSLPCYIPMMQQSTIPCNVKPRLQSPASFFLVQKENQNSSTNHSVAIHMVAASTSNYYVEIVSIVPVTFTPENRLASEPDLGKVSRGDTIGNPFFHVFCSLHFVQMINIAMVEAYQQLVARIQQYETETGFTVTYAQLDPLTMPPFIISKSETGFTLEIQKMMNPQYNSQGILESDFGLHLNVDLSQCFGFHAVKSNVIRGWEEIIIPSESLMNVNGFYYYFTEVRGTPIKIFPWNKLIFSTGTIQVVEMNKSTNNTTVQMQQDLKTSIITDFMLRVSDCDKFYNMCFYNAPNYNRKIMVKSLTTKKFNVQVYAETMDGYKFPLKLKPGTYAVILLVFMGA